MHGYTNHAVLNYYFGRTATALGRGGVVAPERQPILAPAPVPSPAPVEPTTPGRDSAAWA